MRERFKLLIPSLFLIVIIFFYLAFFRVSDSAAKKVFVVESGDNLIKIAKNLESENIISSETLFKIIFVIENGKNKNIAFGEYDFSDKDYTVFDISEKLGSGKADRAGVAITIPEGFTVMDIAKRVQSLYGINSQDFYNYAKDYQGKLFPETYFFEKTITKENIVKKMVSEFEKRSMGIDEQGLVLASIIEGEAKYLKDMKIVSGILKERLSINMPLQVDVALETYKKTGLPSLPINNPGLNAINSVLEPTKTKYLYYITGNDGNMYYAETFAEHKKNIDLYLR